MQGVRKESDNSPRINYVLSPVPVQFFFSLWNTKIIKEAVSTVTSYRKKMGSGGSLVPNMG